MSEISTGERVGSARYPGLRIDGARFRREFDLLCQIGAYGDRGLNRPALSEAHLEARAWFSERAREAGLEVRVDGAGNHSAFLACGPGGAQTLLLGSHLDSVPKGGRYDGALGVLAALEVVRRVGEAGIRLPFHLEAIDFTDEEGTLVSFLGSFAFCGKLSRDELENPRGDREALIAGLARAGLSFDSVLSAQRDPASLACYLELHVEQGPCLEQAGVPIGVVTRIAGISFQRLRYLGTAGHAGTIDMQSRKDAAQGAAAFTLAARRVVLEGFPDCFSNVGSIQLEPGFFNIIPETATLGYEFRAPDERKFRELKAALQGEAETAASRFGLGLEQEFLGARRPVVMSAKIQGAIRAATESLGLAHMPLVARAGHDAQPISDVCPAGMIFVPSAGGISHSPDEFTAWEDCEYGANVLLQAALRYADG
jgi:N-carbamoyl-L-amino-acid hydrolase